MTECGACLDTYWLMADERAGLCPLCITPDKMRAAKWDASQAQRGANAEITRLYARIADLETQAEADQLRDASDFDAAHADAMDAQADALNHLRAYLVGQGLPADPVVIADPHLAALYEALA